MEAAFLLKTAKETKKDRKKDESERDREGGGRQRDKTSQPLAVNILPSIPGRPQQWGGGADGGD